MNGLSCGVPLGGNGHAARRWPGVLLLAWGLTAGSALLAPACAHADVTPMPQTREVFSQNGDYFVRVVPGAGVAGQALGTGSVAVRQPYAVAEFYRRSDDRSYRLTATSALANAIAPDEFFVSNQGHLATVDNWHSEGFGKVVSLYDPAGKLLRAYELTELFDAQEIADMPRAGSSLRWRDGPTFIGQSQTTLRVSGRSGAEFVFGLETGQYRYCESRRQANRCRLGNLPRQWLVNSSVPLER